MSLGSTILPLSQCDDAALCGGKAINLGRMMRAGLPVPDGFVISTAAYRLGLQHGGELPHSLAQEIAAAYRRLGSPRVAVRSSATAEDLAEASMAGQYETLLGVQGEEALLAAVHRCWRSIDSQRLRIYLSEHGIDAASVAMAVVVQRLVAADVAGVLFTANPRTGARDEMLIEAAWGLGEAVVSGMVQPDVVVLDRASGEEKTYTVADKAVWIGPGSDGRATPVAPQRRRVRCLSPQNTRDLWDLSRRVAEHFGSEQDIEWAISEGRPRLLQSRFITTLEQTDAYRECLEGTGERLRELKARGRGDWVRHNIAETLPHPTPLTWSVIRRFMSGSGGFGTLYRKVGFEPSERVCREGFLELIAGRIYTDLALALEMYFEGFPFRYDADLLRCRPDAAQQPPTIPAGSWLKRAATAPRLGAIERSLLELAADCDRQLREQTVPEFVAWVNKEKQCNLAALSAEQWLELWQQRERRVMDLFAPELLLPSMIAAMGLERLRAFLHEHFWSDNPDHLLSVLAVGQRADGTIRANAALRAVGTGQAACEQWLADYGHRGPDEFDLVAPRWREQPDEVRRMAAMLAHGPDPVAVHHQRRAQAEQCAAALRAKLSRRDRREFDERLLLVQRYLPWREDGKAALMLGYDLLRDLALEAGRRLGIGADVFLLTLDELRQALAGAAVPQQAIQARRRRRAAEKRVSLPLWIGPDEIENLGRPPQTSAGRTLQAVPISTGSARGPVRIVHSPREAGELGRAYVLVCPSTDPNWTPLFAGAAALVLECGGMLSHGAVVAREMGIPAVVLPEATQLLVDGETITVDGQSGTVLRQGAADEAAEPTAADPNDVRIAPDQLPPVRGPGERWAARLRNVFLLIWGVYLAAVFLLPQVWLHDPSMRLLDAAFWPLVRALGKPGAVAVMAVGLALMTMIGQRVLTDHGRLVAAKQRAGRLRKEAGRLPAGAPRRTALERAAAGVQGRLLGAAFVPLAVLLGPMVMSFVWLPERVDPASWSAPPGAVAHVTATIDGEYSAPIRLEVDSLLALDEQSAAVQPVPRVRAALRRLLARWQGQAAARHGAAPGSAAAEIPQAMIDDLKQYLNGRMPAEDLTWVIRTPTKPGRYCVALWAGDEAPIRTWLVVGDRFPPEPKEDLGDGRGPVQVVRSPPADGPVRRVTVTYQFARTLGDRVFFAPLEGIAWQALEDRGWTHWDMGWLPTYIVVYLLALFPLRWLLRVP